MGRHHVTGVREMTESARSRTDWWAGCGTVLAMELLYWIALGVTALFLDQTQSMLLFAIGVPVSLPLVLVVHTLVPKRKRQGALTTLRPR